MSNKQLKSIYESLVKSGDLIEMFPELTGTWKFDKEEFKMQYEFSKDSLPGDFEYDGGYEY